MTTCRRGNIEIGTKKMKYKNICLIVNALENKRTDGK